jgi:hypothetical protein
MYGPAVRCKWILLAGIAWSVLARGRAFEDGSGREPIRLIPIPRQRQQSLDPGLEPMALPDLRLDQHEPRRLHEQNPQVAIATPGYLAENQELLEKKQKGQPIAAAKKTAPGNVVNLMDALRASLKSSEKTAPERSAKPPAEKTVKKRKAG